MDYYTWRNLQDESQRDVCCVDLQDKGLTAVGIQTCSEYQASWMLDASTDWITSRIHVQVQGAGWQRSLELIRDSDGVWDQTVSLSGIQPAEMPEPGIAPGTDLSSALDVDLGKCPLTNVMPIRRLGLLSGDVPKTQLIMAWIDMPSLRVIASDQYYSSIDSRHVRYASGTRGVDVSLTVDANGVVTQYPDLALVF